MQNEALPKLNEWGISLVAISNDSAAITQRFKAHSRIDFDIIGDANGSIVESLNLLESGGSDSSGSKIARPVTLIVKDGVVFSQFPGSVSERQSSAELLSYVSSNFSKKHTKPSMGAWNQFRGPNDGKAIGNQKYPRSWDSSRNTLWKVPVPGSGWSSPVVENHELWLTTCVEEHKSLRALCFDVGTGDLKINVEVIRPKKLLEKHPRNSHATPTPVMDEEHVYVHFGSYGTAALRRRDGAIQWVNQDTVIDHQWGPGSSPVLFEELLILNCDGRDKQYVTALNKYNGKVVWKTNRSVEITKGPFFKKAFSTPVLASIKGREILLSAGANQFVVMDPRTGKELWSHEYFGYAGVAVPVFAGNIAVVPSGYGDVSLTAIDLGNQTGGISGKKSGKRIAMRPLFLHPSSLMMN